MIKQPVVIDLRINSEHKGCLGHSAAVAQSSHIIGPPLRYGPGTLAMVFMLVFASVAGAGDDLASREQKAFQAAVDRVAPSVVRIETVGGRDRLGEQLLGTGPTTGLIVGEDGLIVSSAFSFLRRPDSILVQLADGTRKPAQLVATDHGRLITLLKIEPDWPLPLPEMAPRDQTRVGQWAIGVGRTFEVDHPNVSIGIVSALSRIHGRAIQTDAAASPANHGGPLIDARGRVLGVLTPLSPEKDEKTGRIEWYDSGIGFAVPADDVLCSVERLRKGEDLYPGRLGISFTQREPNTAEPVVAGCHPRSPAHGKLKPNDRITAIDGKPVGRVAELLDALGPYYAGDKITLRLERNGKTHKQTLTLVAELPLYERPFLGILPRRDVETTNGPVAVRYVYPYSAAAKAHIEQGDVLLAMDNKPLAGHDDLRQRIAMLQPGDEVTFDVLRDGAKRSVSARLGHLPEGVPDKPLPPARDKTTANNDNQVKRGKLPVRLPEIDNQAWVHVPASHGAAAPSGIVIWLDAPGKVDDAEIMRLWKPVCERDNLMLLVVKPSQPAAWLPNEEAVIARVLDEVMVRYSVDENRIVAHGYQGGGTLAMLVALRHRKLIRGVAMVDTPLPGHPPEADPINPLAFYIFSADKSNKAAQVARSIKALSKAHHPVEQQSIGNVARYLLPTEIENLAKWIDTLDRI